MTPPWLCGHCSGAVRPPFGHAAVRLPSHLPGRFVEVVSTHVIDGSDVHQFTMKIANCATDTATGMRLGVSALDGSMQWVLRLRDGRLCDASGRPTPEPPLIDQKQLPSRYMGRYVHIRCNMRSRSLAFGISHTFASAEGQVCHRARAVAPLPRLPGVRLQRCAALV